MRIEKSPRSSIRFAFVALFLHLIGGIAILGVFHRWELFPIASWSLFSIVPGELTHRTIEITKLDKQILVPPVDFMNSSLELSGRGNINAFYQIQHFVHYVATEDSRRGEAKRLFEEHYLRPGEREIEYRLCKFTFDPLVAWKTGSRGRCEEVSRVSVNK